MIIDLSPHLANFDIFSGAKILGCQQAGANPIGDNEWSDLKLLEETGLGLNGL